MRNLLVSVYNFSVIKLFAIILLWTTAVATLINWYELSWRFAISEAALLTILLLGSMWLLGNIFMFFLPQRSKLWLIFIVPLILAIGVGFINNYSLSSVFSDIKIHDYQRYTLPLKCFISYLLLQGWVFLIVLAGRLEDQRKNVERQEKMESLTKEAELYHLRQQLQPHFLFNSLNSVSALVTSQPAKAREMVLTLADFFRSTIRMNASKSIKVKDEIEHLTLFLQIEKVRFGHRLEVKLETKEGCENNHLPHLLVQPLLENAIKHGLYGILGDVAISVIFYNKNDYLLIEVINPFDKDTGQPKGESFGLQAIKRRLYLLYGRNDLLEIQQSEGKFKATLKIPQQNV